ncbi:MAG: hypothetical protein NZL93_03155, partial [Chthoniobacterales bacterium]|nr:hypothetical protein [Chthoniobacterales bacterium]
MEVLFLALLTIFLYLVAYFTYGRWLARRIFGLEEKRICPSRELCDDRDYVPTHPLVVFGHHFTSIAGTGPIVGPAIGVIWGWFPALVWVILGPIFIGAVYDFAALVMSLRNRGKSIGELAGIYLNQRVRLLFMSILVLSLTVVLAVFGLVISAVFRQFPSAIFPCFVQIPIAIVIGLTLHRRSRGILLPSILALVFMYLSIVFSEWGPFHAFNAALASMPLWLWTLILLIYCYLASVLPVWVLLQPRDFINALQLISTLVLLFLGLLVTAIFGGPLIVETSSKYSLEIVAPLLQVHPSGAPPIFPFLFITIACGAVSGFHCLVSSGTSSKQLSSEPHAQFVGYGAMLLEGFLATLVIL